MTSLKRVWASTLKRAGIPHFPLYELRHTFATRPSAGGVADHFVTQMLRQGEAEVFKRYSQAKFNMMLEVASTAERIVETLVHTKYQHHTHVDEEAGIYEVDCSGFVSYLLQRITPQNYHEIPKETTQNRPRAYKYYEFFAALEPHSPVGWRRIHRLIDTERGDLIAWSFKEVQPHRDSGHVLIVAAKPEITGDGNVAVRIYDFADTPHFDDSRHPGTATSRSVLVRFSASPTRHPSSPPLPGLRNSGVTRRSRI
jgi:hypothetical protein